MDLYLIPNNIENTNLISANGVLHYRIVSTPHMSTGCPQITLIQRADAEAFEDMNDATVAIISWKSKDTPTIISSSLLDPCNNSKELDIPSSTTMKASEFLCKKNRLSSSRYFIGDDSLEYRWRYMKHLGCSLTNVASGLEVAASSSTVRSEGVFAGERQQIFRINPMCSLDIDLVVLSFVLMERKRRSAAGYCRREERNFGGQVGSMEDPAGDGGMEAGDGAADTGGEL